MNIYRWFVPIWFKKLGYWLEHNKYDDWYFAYVVISTCQIWEIKQMMIILLTWYLRFWRLKKDLGFMLEILIVHVTKLRGNAKSWWIKGNTMKLLMLDF